jgi:hypothetical protein
MKFENLFVLVAGATVLATGCMSQEAQRLDGIRHESDWPRIRETAKTEVAKRESDSRWRVDSYFRPTQHTNGVWTVAVVGPYPLNRSADSITLCIRDEGDVTSYQRRFAIYPHLIEHVPR